MDIAFMVLIVVATIWISKLLADLVPVIPMIIWLTTIVLTLAHIQKVKDLLPGQSRLS